MSTDRNGKKIRGFVSLVQRYPDWAVEYVKERRQLCGKKKGGRSNSASVTRQIEAIRETQRVLQKIHSHLPLGSDERDRAERLEQTTKTLSLAEDALETLRTPGRIQDAGICATVLSLSLLYRQQTGNPHYQEVGELMTEYFRDVLDRTVINGDVAEWARKTATRYASVMEKLADDDTFDDTMKRVGKLALLESLA